MEEKFVPLSEQEDSVKRDFVKSVCGLPDLPNHMAQEYYNMNPAFYGKEFRKRWERNSQHRRQMAEKLKLALQRMSLGY